MSKTPVYVTIPGMGNGGSSVTLDDIISQVTGGTSAPQQETESHGLLGDIRAIGAGLLNIPGGMLDTAREAWRGGDISVEDLPEIEASRAEKQAYAEEYAGQAHEPVIDAMLSIPYSMATMGASLGAGVAGSAAGPVAGIAAGMGASGTVAKRAATDQFMQELLLSLRDELGRTPTEEEWQKVRTYFEANADRYGYAEAIPEAISNALFGGIMGKLGTGIINKTGVKNSLGRGLMRLGLEGLQEVPSEVVTGRYQSEEEYAAGLRDEMPTLLDTVEEVAPATLVQSGLMGLVGMGGSAALRRLRRNRDNLSESSADETTNEGMSESVRAGVPAINDPALRDMGTVYDPELLNREDDVEIHDGSTIVTAPVYDEPQSLLDYGGPVVYGDGPLPVGGPVDPRTRFVDSAEESFERNRAGSRSFRNLPARPQKDIEPVGEPYEKVTAEPFNEALQKRITQQELPFGGIQPRQLEYGGSVIYGSGPMNLQQEFVDSAEASFARNRERESAYASGRFSHNGFSKNCIPEDKTVDLLGDDSFSGETWNKLPAQGLLGAGRRPALPSPQGRSTSSMTPAPRGNNVASPSVASGLMGTFMPTVRQSAQPAVMARSSGMVEPARPVQGSSAVNVGPALPSPEVYRTTPQQKAEWARREESARRQDTQDAIRMEANAKLREEADMGAREERRGQDADKFLRDHVIVGTIPGQVQDGGNITSDSTQPGEQQGQDSVFDAFAVRAANVRDEYEGEKLLMDYARAKGWTPSKAERLINIATEAIKKRSSRGIPNQSKVTEKIQVKVEERKTSGQQSDDRPVTASGNEQHIPSLHPDGENPSSSERGSSLAQTSVSGKTPPEDLGNMRSETPTGRRTLGQTYVEEKTPPSSSDAVDTSVPAPTENRNYGTLDAPNIPALSDYFRDMFAEGHRFRNIGEARTLVTRLLGAKLNQRLFKLVDEVMELGVIKRARQIVEQGKSPLETYRELVTLYGQQPNLGVRTSTSIAQQAYSTPVPIAYLTDILAGVTPDMKGVVYEPTAGNGSLLINAGDNVLANELNHDRAERLRSTGLARRVTEYDATDDSWVKQKQFAAAVVANPPFGTVKDKDGRNRVFHVDGFETTEIDQAIMLNALSHLKENGRAAVIIGGKMGNSDEARSAKYNTAGQRAFYKALFDRFNVVKHISLSGELYSKQGAKYPIDIIVIDGHRPTENPVYPAGQVPRMYTSFEELEEVIRGVRSESRSKRSESGDSRGEPRTGGSRGSGERSIERPVEGAGEDRNSGRGLGADRGRQNAPERVGGTPEQRRVLDAGRVQPGRDSVQSEGSQRVRPADGGRVLSSEVGRAGEREGSRRDAGLGSDNVRSGTGGTRLDVEAEKQAERPALPKTEKAKKAAPKAKSTATQTAYVPSSDGFALGTLVPNNMALPVQRALDSVSDEHGGDIDAYVTRELGYKDEDAMHRAFAGEQVDALGMALHNIARGKGFILGDQTGIGKGRVCAGVIRWARKQGKIPVFVTMMPDLYVDMLRDLEDINTAFRPFLTNQGLTGKDALTLPDGSKLASLPKSKYKKAEAEILAGRLPDGYDGIFTTYSQLSGTAGASRRSMLAAINEQVVFIFDEAHNAGGSQSSVGEFVRGITASNPNGVLYSSATFAKRPDIMGLYNKTDLALVGESQEDLEDTMRAGGLAMQQVVSAKLTEGGQYIRREKSFEGATMETVTANVDLKLADEMAESMNAIMEVSLELPPALAKLDKALKREGKKAKEHGGTGSGGASSITFSSVMHNLVAQTTLAIKADAAVEAVKKAVRDGQKPVITLSNTMGSFISEYAKAHGLKNGDAIELSFRDLFKSYLRKSLEVKVKEPGSKKGEEKSFDIREMKDYDIPGRERIERMAAEVERLIDRADIGRLPVSPIDYIIDALGREGIRAGEITGRTEGVHYDADGRTSYYTREAGSAVKVRASGGFNSGDLDCLVINRSGSTGISLHASEKFADQRRRNMIILQPDLNIDVFMQTLGRVFRTGQVVPPVYQFLLSDMPSEKRPAAVLGKKMASLNANTTASAKGTQSFDNIPDFLNMYGDQAAYELLSEDEEINRTLGYPLEESDSGSTPDISGLAAKLTGRIPLLKAAEQAEIYDRLEALYHAAVELAEANGTSGLNATTRELDAKKLRSMQLTPPKPGASGPFSGPSYVSEYDVKVQGKPFSSKEVLKHIEEHKTPELEELKKKGADYLRERIKGKDEEAGQAEQDRVNAQWRHVQGIIDDFPVGTKVSLTGEGNAFEGFVTNIMFTDKKKGGNPVAPSSWKIVVDVADARRQVAVPFSKLVDGGGRLDGGKMAIGHNGRSREALLKRFDEAQSASREKRYIVTGNLVEGYNKMDHKGDIISFRNADGTVDMGIVLPKNMDVQRFLDEMPVRFRTSAFAEKFMGAMGDSIPVVLQTGDGFLRISGSRKDGFRLFARYKKADGARYYLDDKLIRLVGGDFIKSGQEMRSPKVDAEDMPQILSYLYGEKGVSLNTSTNREAAREITGDSHEFSEQRPLASRQMGEGDEDFSGTFRMAGRYLPPRKRRAAKLRAAAVQRVVDTLNGRAENAAPVHVVQTAKELPDNIRALFDGHLDEVEGVYDPATGAVWMVADNISDSARAAEVWAHEQVGHHGLRGMFSREERRRILNQLWLSLGGMGNAGIRDIAERYGLDPRRLQDDRQTVMEEYVAHMAEKRQRGRLNGKEESLWRRIVSAVLRFWNRAVQAVSGREGRMTHENIDSLLSELGEYVWAGRGRKMHVGAGMTGTEALASQKRTAREITPEAEHAAWEQLQKDMAEWGRQVEAFVVSKKTRPLLNVCRTPDALRKLGAPDLPMTMTASNLEKILSDKQDHQLPPSLVKQLPKALAEPVMVFESATSADSFVVLTELKHEGRSVMAAIHLDTERQRIRVNDIASAYKRGNEAWYIRQIEDGRLLYQDKKKSLAWARTNRLQLPQVRKLPARLSENRILTDTDIVKPVEHPELRAPAGERPLASLSHRDRRRALADLISEWSSRTGQKKEAMHRALREYFNVDRIDSIPEEWMQDAEDFVQEKLDAIPEPSRPGFLNRLFTMDMKKTAAMADIPEIQKFFHDDDLGLLSHFVALPHWIAKKYPAFARVYERQLKRMDERSASLKKSLEAVPGLFGKNRIGRKDMERLRKILWETEGQEPKELEGVEKFRAAEKLPNGRRLIEVNPEFYEAYEKWVDGMDATAAAKRTLIEIRKSLDADLVMAHNRMAEMREVNDDAIRKFRQNIGHVPNYFPHHRYGKYFVQAKVDREVVFRQHFDAAGKARAGRVADSIVAAQRGNFPGASWSMGDNVRLPDEVLGAPIDTEAMEQIIRAATSRIADKKHAKEVADLLMEGTADVLKSRGWGEHGIQRKGIPGFEQQDIVRVLYDYKAGLNGWLTKMEAARDFGEALRNIDAGRTPQLWRYTSQYVKDMLRNSDRIDRISGNIKSVAFAWYLGGSIKTAMVNLTQNLVTGIPRLQMDVTGAAGSWLRGAHKAIAGRVSGGKSGLTEEEARLLYELDGESVITDAYMEEIRGQLGSRPRNVWNRFTKILGLPMSEVEKFNRASLALAAFRAARAGNMKFRARRQYGVKGMKADYAQAKAFAADVVKDAHFVYGKSNMPEFLRSNAAGRAASSMFTFRSFTFNMLGMWAWALRSQGHEGVKFIARSLGATMALGGVTALPFYATAMALFQAASGDDDDWTELLRQAMPENNLLRDVVCYGLPTVAGVNLGGSLQMETSLTRGLQKGSTPKEVLTESFGDIIGIPYDLLLEKPSKVADAARYGDAWRMAEEAAPVAVKNVLQAVRLHTVGQTTMSGRPINEPGEPGARRLSGAEAVGKALGFQPVSSTKSYAAYAARNHAEAVRDDMLDELTVLALKSYDTGEPAGKLEMRRKMREWNRKMEAEGKPHMFIHEKDVMRRVKARRRENRVTPKSMQQRERNQAVWG